ncbi:unnamed protein product, partial [Mesorhabditis belari]|uniref:Protein kinase C n=1 Tax=Mesorhabditis belari TaxID=2138241 RepID=A0AAF3FNU8_9BILA
MKFRSLALSLRVFGVKGFKGLLPHDVAEVDSVEEGHCELAVDPDWRMSRAESACRLKLLRAEVGNEVLPPGCSPTDLVAAVNVKEKIEINGKCWDTAVTPGRIIQVVLMHNQTPVVDATMRLEDIVSKCKGDQITHIWINTKPSGRILAQARHLKNAEEMPTSISSPQKQQSSGKSSRSNKDEDNDEIAADEGMNARGFGSSHGNGIQRRRGAIKHAKVHEIRGHQFVATFFRQFTFCQFCSDFMWGLNKQGYQCQLCSASVHKKCHDKLLTQCPGSAKNTKETIALKERFKVDIPHRFKVYNFKSPTFCDHCGSMLYGLFKQGLRCEVCNVACHHKCEKLIPNLCGVNQKQLSEALLEIKQGKHPHSVPNMSAMSLGENGMKGNGVMPKGYVKELWTGGDKKYNLSNFTMAKVLGKGSFGKVLLVELKGKSEYYAMKCLKKDVILEDDDTECTYIERRVLILASQCPFLCQMFCSFQTNEYLFFVMEYLNGGDLMHHIQQVKRFDETRTRFYACEIIIALQFLHSNNIIYRDLKLDNILLDSEGHVKLADFGMAKTEMNRENGMASTFCGTPDYISPEIIKGQLYNEAVDFWSFGVLMYEMLVGQSPFHGEGEDELFDSILNERPYFPKSISKEAAKCLSALFDRNPNTRLGMPECPDGPVRQHAFFRGIDWKRFEARQMQPPFKPNIKSASDASNFDEDFTSEKAVLTPIHDKNLLASIDPEAFLNFSYTNPQFLN